MHNETTTLIQEKCAFFSNIQKGDLNAVHKQVLEDPAYLSLRLYANDLKTLFPDAAEALALEELEYLTPLDFAAISHQSAFINYFKSAGLTIFQNTIYLVSPEIRCDLADVKRSIIGTPPPLPSSESPSATIWQAFETNFASKEDQFDFLKAWLAHDPNCVHEPDPKNNKMSLLETALISGDIYSLKWIQLFFEYGAKIYVDLVLFCIEKSAYTVDTNYNQSLINAKLQMLAPLNIEYTDIEKAISTALQMNYTKVATFLLENFKFNFVANYPDKSFYLLHEVMQKAPQHLALLLCLIANKMQCSPLEYPNAEGHTLMHLFAAGSYDKSKIRAEQLFQVLQNFHWNAVNHINPHPLNHITPYELALAKGNAKEAALIRQNTDYSALPLTPTTPQSSFNPARLIPGKTINEGHQSKIKLGIWNYTTVIVKSYLTANPDAAENFAKEVEILNTLRSPNIVNIFGSQKIPGRSDIIMEYTPHGSLHELITNGNTKLLLRDMVIVALDIAKALLLLHDNAIIHCDLKPANMLVFYTCARISVKLCDFGLAQYANKVDKKEAVGTPTHVAPEIMSKNPKFSCMNDIYSFGIVLTELWNQKEAWEELPIDFPIEKLCTLVLNGQRPHIDRKPPLFYRNLITACWQHQPELRPTPQIIIESLMQEQDTSEFLGKNSEPSKSTRSNSFS